MSLKTFDKRNVDGIVESGTNTNGSWVKYDNGIMVCWQRYKVSWSGLSTWGNIYYKDLTSLMKNYPQTFASVPTATISLENSNGWDGWISPTGNSGTVSKPSGQNFLRPTTASGTIEVFLNVVAFGEWQ